MIEYIRGNIFTSNAKVLVNTVNTVGIMGKGVALEFKKYYPKMYQEYKDLCDNNQLNIGDLHLYKTTNKWILNFPTKKHWRNPSKLDIHTLFCTLKSLGRLSYVDIHHELYAYRHEILDFFSILNYIVRNHDKIVLNYTETIEEIELETLDAI